MEWPGEVGLAGELRPASSVELRLSCAQQSGFKRCLVALSGAGAGHSHHKPPSGLAVTYVSTLHDAVTIACGAGRVDRSEHEAYR